MRDDFDDFDDFDGEPEPAFGPPHPEPAPARRPRWAITVAVTALIAATVGFLLATAARDISAGPAVASSSSPAAMPSSGAMPSGGAIPPGGAMPSGGAVPPGDAVPMTPGPGQLLHLRIGGKVTAVSATSITITGGSQQVTAAVTSSTKVTGRVTSIAGVKKGDFVAAQITGADGKLTATALQDPASQP